MGEGENYTDNAADLFQKAASVRPGHEVRWLGEKSDVDSPRNRTVRRVELRRQSVEIVADGPETDKIAQCEIHRDGSSTVYYGTDDERNMGKIDFFSIR